MSNKDNTLIYAIAAAGLAYVFRAQLAAALAPAAAATTVAPASDATMTTVYTAPPPVTTPPPAAPPTPAAPPPVTTPPPAPAPVNNCGPMPDRLLTGAAAVGQPIDPSWGAPLNPAYANWVTCTDNYRAAYRAAAGLSGILRTTAIMPGRSWTR